MITETASICIEAPATRVWTQLARLEDIALWSEAVREARCEGPRRRGVGAERSCDLVGGVTIHERWTEWDEGRSFAYEGLGIPLVGRAANRWTVEAVGDRTLLSTHAQVVVRGGRVGRLLEPLIAWQARRAGSRALRAFKHLVERGGPPAVRHARLPRAPAGC